MNLKNAFAALFLPAILLAHPSNSQEEIRRGLAAPAYTVTFDKLVSPDYINGSGNTNEKFTLGTSKDGKIQVGLRAKVRYNSSNQPENTYNSNGNGSYNHLAGAGPFLRAKWNFEWAINTQVGCNIATTACTSVNSYAYEIALDKDPTIANVPLVWDPIQVTCVDHSFGTSTTTSATDVSVNCANPDLSGPATYKATLTSSTVAQQSWNYGFFPTTLPFDPTVEGIYDISLSVKNKTSGSLLDKVTIRVLVSDPTKCTTRGKCFPTVKADCSGSNLAKFSAFFKTTKECEDFLKPVAQ